MRLKKMLIPILVLLTSFLFISKPMAYTSSSYDINDYVLSTGSTLQQLNNSTYGRYNMFTSTTFVNASAPILFTFGFNLPTTYSNYDYFIFSGLSNGTVSSASGCETISSAGSIQYINGLTPFTIKCYIGDLSSFKGNYQHLNYSINYPQNSSTNITATIYLYNTIYLSNDVDQATAVQVSLDNLNKTQQETNNKLDDLNNSINDNNVDNASNTASDFFSGFTDNDYGLSDIVKMPLTFIQNITSSTCTPLSFPLPFVNKNVELPCMMSIYKTHFQAILTVWQTISFGIVAYWVCINIFRSVKNFKDPTTDEIEVFDL